MCKNFAPVELACRPNEIESNRPPPTLTSRAKVSAAAAATRPSFLGSKSLADIARELSIATCGRRQLEALRRRRCRQSSCFEFSLGAASFGAGRKFGSSRGAGDAANRQPNLLAQLGRRNTVILARGGLDCGISARNCTAQPLRRRTNFCSSTICSRKRRGSFVAQLIARRRAALIKSPHRVDLARARLPAAPKAEQRGGKKVFIMSFAKLANAN